MKLKIREPLFKANDPNNYPIDSVITHDDGENIAHILRPDARDNYDPEYVARLFQKAEELLEFADDRCNFSAMEMSNKWDKHDSQKNIRTITGYIYDGEEEMVTLRMSKASAEKANFLQFKVE